MSHPRAVRFLWGREEGGVLSMVKHGGSCRLGGGWKEVIRDYKEKEKNLEPPLPGATVGGF